MTYNQSLLLLVSIATFGTGLFFLFDGIPDNNHIGYISLGILIAVNAFYYFFSNEWLNRRKRF